MRRATAVELGNLASAIEAGEKRRGSGVSHVTVGDGVDDSADGSTAASKAGGAVGFLDLIDEGEVAALEAERREEEAWLVDALQNITKSLTLLENVTLCMNRYPDSWRYYVMSLLCIFQATDEVDTLIRFWVESEVQGTKKESSLFREDSIRIRGLQQYFLTQIKGWFRDVVFRPVIRKLLNTQVRGSTHGRMVEAVALDVMRALNAHVAQLPLGVQQTLSKIATAVANRFPHMKKTQDSHMYACVFLFLHIITPSIVDPFMMGFTTSELHDRDAVFLLARVGKQVQSLVNNCCYYNDYSNSSGASSATSDLSQSEDDPTSRRGTQTRPAGEQEVQKFVEAIFKIDAPRVPQEPISAEVLQDAKQVVSGTLKKNYKLLRDLEGALDRQQVLEKHLGAVQARLFASTPIGDIARTSRSVSVPESMVELAAQAEAAVAGCFVDMRRNTGAAPCDLSIHGVRYVFVGMLGLSQVFPALRSVTECASPHMVAVLNAGLWREVGADNFRMMLRECDFKNWQAAVLALFPFLAYSGRGRATVTIGSALAKGADFLLLVKMENSLEAGGEVARKGDCKCQCMSGFIGGWCSVAANIEMQAVETACVGRGDKACFFVVAPLLTLEAHVKRLQAEVKVGLSPRAQALLDTAAGVLALPDVPSTPGSGAEPSAGDDLHAAKDASRKTKLKRDSKPASPTPTLVSQTSTDDLSASAKKGKLKKESKGSSAPTSTGVSSPASAMLLSYACDQLRVALAREASAKVGKVVSSKATSTLRRTAGAAQAAPRMSFSDNDPFLTPTSTTEVGEIHIASQRYALFRGADFGASFLRSAQALLRRDGSNSSCLRCGHKNEPGFKTCAACSSKSLAMKRRQPSGTNPLAEKDGVNGDDVVQSNRVATTLLYLYGVVTGDAAAEHAIQSTARVQASPELQFDLMKSVVTALGWGDISISSLSRVTDSGTDFWMLCRVSDSIEAVDRLGSMLDPTGSPTCTMLAGMIAGWASRVVGARCVCVEVECVGCGSSQGGVCAFVCSLPSTIVNHTKLWLAVTGQEDTWPTLCGAIGVDALSGNEASELPSPQKFSLFNARKTSK